MTETQTHPSPRDVPSVDDLRGLDTGTLVSRMRIGVEAFDPRVFDMNDEDLDRAWLPDAGVGRWPVRVLLGHLADTEMLYASRIRTILALDNPTLLLFDEHAFIDSGIYGCTEGSTLRPPIGGDVAMIHTTRCWLVALLFQLDGSQWSRAGLHPERGAITVREIALGACWHLEHHAWFLNAKVERLLGPRPEPEACNPGSCGNPNCACVEPGDGS